MAYEPADLAHMIAERAARTDPSLSAVEAVLLRSALERLDDFLLWLDQHTAAEHADESLPVARTLAAVHGRLVTELGYVDAAIVRIEE